MAQGWSAAGVMAADPVVVLVVLLQGAMPTAQNLVVLLHLDDKARLPSHPRPPPCPLPPRPLPCPLTVISPAFAPTL